MRSFRKWRQVAKFKYLEHIQNPVARPKQLNPEQPINDAVRCRMKRAGGSPQFSPLRAEKNHENLRQGSRMCWRCSKESAAAR
jgi:protein tyrosine phosphatase (PTP) superfamily phosphohydrolase (DUF442 family)